VTCTGVCEVVPIDLNFCETFPAALNWGNKSPFFADMPRVDLQLKKPIYCPCLSFFIAGSHIHVLDKVTHVQASSLLSYHLSMSIPC